jgi:hypothetical protein
MFHKTRNLKDSRRSTASDRFTSRTTFRTGFEKCCHSPSGFCEPVGFVEYALEYFEMGCVVVEMVERDMQTDRRYSHTIMIPSAHAFHCTARSTRGRVGRIHFLPKRTQRDHGQALVSLLCDPRRAFRPHRCSPQCTPPPEVDRATTCGVSILSDEEVGPYVARRVLHCADQTPIS